MPTTNVAGTGLLYLYRCAVTAVALAVLYGVYEALGRGEPNPTAWALLAGVSMLAALAATAAWSRRGLAVSVQLVVIPALAALYLFEARQRDPIDEMLHVEQMWRLVKSRKESGQPISVQYSPSDLLPTPAGFKLPSGAQAFPVSPGYANVPTIMCREGPRPFAEYVADEHGFNNPQGIWGKPVDLIFVGDSMTYGACLPNRDHFIAQVREKHPAILNLGAGGTGPLIQLAAVREFVPHARPRHVFYMYDENNDLYVPSLPEPDRSDLAREYRNHLLRRYLEDDEFTQGLVRLQPELHALLKRYMDSTIDQALARRTPAKRLVKFLGLPLTRAGLPPVKLTLGDVLFGAALAAQTEAEQFELFKAIFGKMVQASQRAGANFVFVNIPAQPTVCNGMNHPLKKEVLDFVARSGVDMIDLEDDFKEAVRTLGREAIFAVPVCGGHFSERGYKVIGDRLVAYLQRKQGMPAAQ
jgi:hypothetical protein